MSKEYINQVICGDCLGIMKDIPDKSVDMVLCDLPYGTTQSKWDSIIPLKQIWEQYHRIVKDNGAIVLTSQGVFTAKLILSNEKYFKYKIVWMKSNSTNFLNAKRQPLRKHEDICVFYKKQSTYNPQMSKGDPYSKIRTPESVALCYGSYIPSYHSTNDGVRYPNDIIYFRTAENEGKYHINQKPVELGRYLIKTYTNPEDVVLDNTCGSGSFLMAAVLEGRKFIGIEKETKYIKACQKRLSEI